MMMSEYAYFKPDEFAACTPACSIDDMDSAFMHRLDSARCIADVPFRLNSAYRSKDYELLNHRSGTSSHCKGLAVDISCLTSYYRYRILFALFACKFKRIGIYPTFIHVDADDSKPDAIWYGK